MLFVTFTQVLRTSRFFPNRRYFLRVLILHQRGDYTETDTKREAISWPAGKFCLGCFHFVRTFPSKPKFTYCFIHSKNFPLEKQMLFSLFCFFCIFAQGFSLKTQLVEQNTNKMTINSMFSEPKTPKTQQNKCFFNISERKHNKTNGFSTVRHFRVKAQ